MSLFKKSAQQTGVLALSFNGQGVRFAHVWRPAAGRPAVLRCESYRLQADNPAALEKLRKDARLDQYQCATLLDASEYQMLQVEAPAVPKPELKAAIRWRIKDLLNYPIDDAMVDVFDIPPSRDAPARSHAMYAVVSR
ncbi:MAG: agglutinin biogenesis protein MshI, partial [Burkholderiales bacterium]